MPKRTLFTNITPLPPQVSREVAVAMLHNHDEMIELNPLVIEHHPIKTPRDAPADEFLGCVWQELTDKINYGVAKGKVSYKACFHDTPNGLQTHIYAPLGLDIREKWSIGGTLPGEPPEARELGVETPRQGLYIREDGDMRCNRMLSSFVRKNLDNAHKVLVERILKKAEMVEEHVQATSAYPTSPGPQNTRFQPGSHMAKSSLLNNDYQRPLSPQMLSPQQDHGGWQNMANHPAYRSQIDEKSGYLQNGRPMSTSTLPQYQGHDPRTGYYSQISGVQQQQMQQNYQHAGLTAPKQFVAELPGSTYHTGHHLSGTPGQPTPPQSDYRMSMVSELSGGSDNATPRGSPSGHHNSATYSDRSSMISELPLSHAQPQQYQQQQQQYKYNNPNEIAQQSVGSSNTSDRFSMVSELPSDQQQQLRNT
ncbi:hypothetical protein LTR84_000113 [Exophiala bonariae]|uniref:DUF7053 domain-containing protein n=1 Tax=Exophiala bonariae TaxID=1690606 RepID=A0AAV9NS97_9EURO|nr:hypothetical protein LTR84_000113 [Exophiala bonariae]